MSINNINSLYTKLLNAQKEKSGNQGTASSDKTTGTDSTGKVTTNTTTANSLLNGMKTDLLDLNSDSTGVEEYLNYGQMAKYNQPNLADFLSGAESGSEAMDLSSIMSNSDSSESNSGMFDGLIQSTIQHNNQMINEAVKKYASTNSTNSADFAKKLDALKAEIKAEMDKSK